MKNCNESDLVITGIGVTSSIGQGKADFITALLKGNHNFDVMRRPGRQAPSENGDFTTSFLGSEIPELKWPGRISQNLLRTTSFSSQVGIATLSEAWEDAQLNDVDPYRIGLIVGGSNFQQRGLIQTYATYKNRVQFLNPTYGISFLDSDICGLATELFGIKGFAFTQGGASASGQVAVIQAINSVLSGCVDVCIALGALMDLSYWECQGLKSLGAMGSDRYSDSPAMACRPFDKNRDGFIFGESCGAVVIEKHNMRKHTKPYSRIIGWDMCMDGNRTPSPSLEGEIRVINQTLKKANLPPESIDYVNPHGTGSLVGDSTELKAIESSRLNHAYINATKSIIGHGLSSAGAVEIIATLLQMQEGHLHPTRNLDEPMLSNYNWIKEKSIPHKIQNAISLSMGFGGVNSAVCLQQFN